MSYQDRQTPSRADESRTDGLSIAHPGFAGLIGAAKRDITPPVGIFNRMWAAATESTAIGIHRPLFATAVSMRSSADDPPLVVVALDLGWWRSAADERALREPILDHFGLGEAQLMIHLTHTHAGPGTSLSSCDKPGGELVGPYMNQVRVHAIEAIAEAMDSARPACMEWTKGRCDLATHRLLPNPDGSGILVGFNPDVPADDTLLVGRVVDGSGQLICTLLNYACHPTSLGPGNRMISPDYMGAARDVLEQATGGVPCMFMQGASSDLGPRNGFASDTAIADQNGRQLGYAALGALEGMLAPQQRLAFAKALVSGASLAMWEPRPRSVGSSQAFEKTQIDLPLRRLASASELAQRFKACDDPVMSERLDRAYQLRVTLNDAKNLVMHVWIWRVGEICFVGIPAEAHSHLQIKLRQRYPTLAIVVLNIVNGYLSYLPKRDEYHAGSYQADVSLYEAGSLERMIEACGEAIDSLAGMNTGASTDTPAINDLNGDLMYDAHKRCITDPASEDQA